MTRLWAAHEDRRLAERFGPRNETYRNATSAMVSDTARTLRFLRLRD